MLYDTSIAIQLSMTLPFMMAISQKRSFSAAKLLIIILIRNRYRSKSEMEQSSDPASDVLGTDLFHCVYIISHVQRIVFPIISHSDCADVHHSSV